LFTPAGWQGRWQNQGWGRKAGGTRDVSQTRQLRSTGGDGGTGQLPDCAGGTGQLKEGTAVSVERAGRPGQLACPEDTLEQLCRFPRAIWLTRTYLAHQVTILSTRLFPAHPFPARQAPQHYPAAPIVTLFTTHGHLAGKFAQMPPQEWTPKVTATTRAQPDCQGSDTWPRLSSRRVPWALGEM